MLSRDAAEWRKCLSEIIKASRQAGGNRLAKGRNAHALGSLEEDRQRPGASPGATMSPVSSDARVSLPVDLDQALESEYRKGVEEGMARVEMAMRAEFDSRLSEERAQLLALHAGIAEQMRHLMDRMARESFRFALAVAAKVVKREVTLDKEVIIRQIHEAVRRVAGVESVKLRLNPQDEAIVRERRSELLGATDSVRDLILEADDKVERGGCILETPSGNVDARWSTQLDQIEAALFGNVLH